MKRTAYYGGSFDPVHRGHLEIAHTLMSQFELDRFTFIPAFHAPHKIGQKPSSAYDRYAMLCLVTQPHLRMSVSKMELELPEKPFTVETLSRLIAERPDEEIFFVMGADSWMDIKTWRDWERVLAMTNHIVVTRPGTRLGIDHVGEEIGRRIIDLRSAESAAGDDAGPHIYLTDRVMADVSATAIREKVGKNDPSWRADVSPEVAIYIEKYQIYK